VRAAACHRAVPNAVPSSSLRTPADRDAA
jgi:hypothetical protein